MDLLQAWFGDDTSSIANEGEEEEEEEDQEQQKRGEADVGAEKRISSSNVTDNIHSSSVHNISLTPIIPLEKLPPLPAPKGRTQRQETLCGVSLVFVIIGILLGLTHSIPLMIGYDFGTVAWWIIFGVIYGQAGLALLCLAGILWVDPGVVPRNAETCYPLPPAIAAWLSSKSSIGGDPITELDRPSDPYFPSLDEQSQDTYCTRCLVWRKAYEDDFNTKAKLKTIRYFHCNICQRCVGHYDHHCGIFGRCIAGPKDCKRCGGNIKFFWGIMVIGCTAYLTTLGCILAGLVAAFGPNLVLPIFLPAVVVVHLASPCVQQILSNACRWCRCFRCCC